MKKLILLGLIIALVGCAGRQNVIELGAGYDHHIDEGKNPQSVMRYRNEPLKEGWVYEFNHHSSIPNGYPFNKKEEDLVNQHSIIYRWVF